MGSSSNKHKHSKSDKNHKKAKRLNPEENSEII